MAANRRALPQAIGRYEVILPIATGGMATVYLARQHGLAGFGRDVAVKLMHAHLDVEEHWRTEFVEEAKLAASIHHPNVVEVVDVGEDPSGTYLVMTYVEGESLAGVARSARETGTPIDRGVALRMLVDALAGLHAAHVHEDADGRPLHVVHRDFSPQNVLVGTDGISRLTDFGIAKAASRLTFTHTGTVKGKVAYMSPEQARGLAVDRRCDVWAAGVIAWELFANRRLHPPGEEVSIGLRVVSERPADLREIDPAIPESIASAVAWALEPDLAARCPTAEALSRRLTEGQTVADVAQVAALVTALVRDKLVARKTRATEVARLRQETSSSGVKTVAPVPLANVDVPVVDEPSRTAGLVVDATRIPSRAPRGREDSRSRAALWAIGGAMLVMAAAGSAIYARSRRTAVVSEATLAAPVVQVSALTITANVPLLAVRVGARDLVPDTAARTVLVQVDPTVLAGTPDVEAVTTDGRRKVLKLPAGASTVSFVFDAIDAGLAAAQPTPPAPPAPPARAPRAAHPSPSRPAPSATARPGLADNPYEHAP